MAQATSTEQPAVVLRSRFNHPRALVAVATVVLVGLTGAVAILMTDDQVDTGGGSENPLCALTSKERHRVEGLSSRSPAQLASSFGRATVPAPPPGTPYHGDPGIFGPPPGTPYHGDPGIFGPPPSTPYDGDWGCLPVPPPRARFATEMQGEAGTSAAIAQSSGGTKFRGSKTS